MQFLYQRLREEIGSKNISRLQIPPSIRQNLHPNLEIRPYQERAFQHFLAFMDAENGFCESTRHLLFQMATGSGKTMMMAGLILYLYEQGYRNFLFFVNSTNIIDKTKDNFLNGTSPKYLFAPQIKIGQRLVNIISSDNFEGNHDHDICIVFDTIQGLHSKLNAPRENALTLNDFEDKKIVLIADEAHHLSAGTKKGTLLISDDDAFSWEGTVLKILDSHKQNLLLDFTATAELRNEYVAAKYKDKLLFDYSLKEFRKDGYSKEVEIFKSDSELMERALQALMLSHYRKKKFADLGFDIKPVILFKSKNVEPSKQFMQAFIAKIETLQASDLEHIKNTNTDGILKIVFDYFADKKLDITDLIAELKADFSEERCVSANDDKEKTKLQIQLNTLESPDNPIRAVFAVDKLNEGWDVLNLFDIVRLYETRDTGRAKMGKGTAAEAQLIGRGVRYCPFAMEGFAKDKRKFDRDIENPYRICETMYYHSNNDSRYINEITQALIDTGIVEDKTRQVRLDLKESFKKSAIYKKGLIFLNEQTAIKPLTLELDSDIRQKIYHIDLFSGKTATSKVFKTDGEEINEHSNNNIAKKPKAIKILDLGIAVIRKAIHQTKGFEFDILQKKFSQLASINEFITSPYYLGNIEIHISGGASQIENMSQDEKLHTAKQVLKELHIIDGAAEQQFKGTKVFKAMPLRTIIKEKVVNYPIDSEEMSSGMSEPTSRYYDRDILTADWYAFTDCYGTAEEKALVKFMKTKYEQLKNEYDEFYLVRNERHFAIYDFDKGRRFEPDFVLFLKKKNEDKITHYQIFIEPKGEYLMKEDAWKQNFLLELHHDAILEKTAWGNNKDLDNFIQIFGKDEEFTIWGLPFFNEKDQYVVSFNNALGDISIK